MKHAFSYSSTPLNLCHSFEISLEQYNNFGIQNNLVVDARTKIEMTGDSNTPEMVPEMVQPPKTQTPLRTYSRRALKRMLTAPPLPVDTKILRRAQSFFAAAPESSPEHKSINAGRRRTGLSLPASSGQTPTDLFFEHMSSPFVLSQQMQQQEQGLGQGLQDDQEEIALLVTNQDGDAAFDDNKSAEDPVRAVLELQSTIEACDTFEVAAAEEFGPSDENSEDTDDDDRKELPTKRTQIITEAKLPGSSDAELDFVHAANKSSSRRMRRYKLLSLSPPVDQKSKAKRHFDAPKSPPPAGFKTIPRVQTRLGVMGFDQERKRTDKAFKAIKPTNNQPFMVDKHIGDGFTNDEAKPSPYRKAERRTKNTLTETRLAGLDLTQRGAATQKMEGPTWPRGQKRSRAATTASLWGNRQYLGGSHIQMESQDPLEAFSINEEPDSETIYNSGRSKRRISEIVDDDDEAKLGPLTHPDELDDHSNQGDAGDDRGSTAMMEHWQDRAEKYISDADEPVVLLEFPDEGEDEDEDGLATIPRTDTPEPAVGDTSSEISLGSCGNNDLNVQLPPKRTWDLLLNCDGDALTLRPDSREWLREAERVLDTPPRKDAVGRR